MQKRLLSDTNYLQGQRFSLALAIPISTAYKRIGASTEAFDSGIHVAASPA